MTHTFREQQPLGGGEPSRGGESGAGFDAAEPWWGTFLDRAPAQGAAAGDNEEEEEQSAAEPGASTTADGRGGRSGRGGRGLGPPGGRWGAVGGRPS